jgi:hypothetical protein
MSRTLSTARDAFVAAISRDTADTELPRLVAVLDALIAWSAARPGQLAFRSDEGRTDVLRFERVGAGAGAGAKAMFWSAQVTRGTGPRLEIHAPTGRPLSDEDRTVVRDTLNAHSREVLVEGDRLRIGFGALKNAAALTAVLTLMDRLLAGTAQPATSPESAGPAA